MPQQPPVRVVAGWATDVGRVRDHNEDAALVTDSVFVVADGMGGHAAGEVASALAVDAVRRAADGVLLSPEGFVEAVEQANTAILREMMTNSDQLGMATTLTGLALVWGGEGEHHRGRPAGHGAPADGGPQPGPQWEVVNVGDSRVYRWFDGELVQVTQDHSEVGDLVRMGVITEQEARRHPARNIVTRCLGRLPADPVDSWTFAATPGERWLACSDGLTNELVDEQVAALLSDGDDPQAVAQALVAAAVEHGGRDNVTVVVVFTVST